MTPEDTKNPSDGKPPEAANKKQISDNPSLGKTGEAGQTNEPIIKGPDELPLEKWLWVDPFAANAELKQRLDSGAVLLAEDIVRYVSYNLLIDKQDFASGAAMGAKLKGASYTMTPDPDQGWMINEENKLVKLKVEEDPAGRYFVVPKHSLVFIGLKQRLRVPFYIIGRHNLKITYVYQGLLLGTGPQVDPGYVGKRNLTYHWLQAGRFFRVVNRNPLRTYLSFPKAKSESNKILIHDL
jgi:hypothetical protein